MKGIPPVKPLFSLVVTSALLAVAPAASAQAPAAPVARDANLTVKLDAGIYYRARPYVLKGDKVRVTGALTPYVPGEKVLVEFSKQGH